MEIKLFWNRIYMVWATCLVAVLLLPACLKKDYTQKEFVAENMLITEYLKTDTTTNTSLFLKILEKTGYDKILGTYGTFTVFVPTNDAINQFISESGKTSIDDFTNDYLVKLVKAHIVNTAFNSFQFKSGALEDSTLLGNYLMVSFAATGFSETYINRTAKVILKDIICSNGIIHKIDHVLTPVIDNLYTYIMNTPDYSYFAKAIVETGYDSLLKLCTYNDNMRRRVERSYTLFAESNSIMEAKGIGSYDDLKLRYCNTGNPRNRNDSLNLFVGYHILTGRIYSSNFTSKNYSTAGYDLLISILTDDGTVKMNPDSVGEEAKPVWVDSIRAYVNLTVTKYSYVNFIDGRTDIDATNGVIHEIDNIMAPKKPVAQTYLQPIFDQWIKQYIDSVSGKKVYQTAAGEKRKIWARDSVLSYFRGRMSWVINYLGTKAPSTTNDNSLDDREICYCNQQKVANGGHFLGSILTTPEGDGNGNCLWVAQYNEYEIIINTDDIVPGSYKVGLGYKNGSRYTIRVIIDDDPSLLEEKASIISPSYGATTGYVSSTGQTFIPSIGAKRDQYTGNEFVECQMGIVKFPDKRKHKVKITNMIQYGAPGGNFGTPSLLDYIRFEAVKK